MNYLPPVKRFPQFLPEGYLPRNFQPAIAYTDRNAADKEATGMDKNGGNPDDLDDLIYSDAWQISER